MHHRRKGGQGGSSEATLYPDRVQARWCGGHAGMLQPDLVRRRRRNLVIVRATGIALLRRCLVARSWGEPQLPCAPDGGGAIARTELGIDIADVGADRVDRNVELARDLGSRQICRQIPQYAQLAWAQVLRWRQELSLGARRRCASQHVGDVGEESAVS